MLEPSLRRLVLRYYVFSDRSYPNEFETGGKVSRRRGQTRLCLLSQTAAPSESHFSFGIGRAKSARFARHIVRADTETFLTSMVRLMAGDAPK